MNFPLTRLVGRVIGYFFSLINSRWMPTRSWRILVSREGQGLSGLQILVSGDEVGRTDVHGLSPALHTPQGSRAEIHVFAGPKLIWQGIREVPDIDKSIYTIDLPV